MLWSIKIYEKWWTVLWKLRMTTEKAPKYRMCCYYKLEKPEEYLLLGHTGNYCSIKKLADTLQSGFFGAEVHRVNKVFKSNLQACKEGGVCEKCYGVSRRDKMGMNIYRQYLYI
jgi:hypothetical protein